MTSKHLIVGLFLFMFALHFSAAGNEKKKNSRAPLSFRPEPACKCNKTYICILMVDYDSATPLYDFLPNHWHNAARGKLPLAWGINPNLLETYPDIISYYYETAYAPDTAGALATAENISFRRHNRAAFNSW
ncbi:MAG: hypothetical protein ACR2H1_10480 [Limisphaerales bacterium]